MFILFVKFSQFLLELLSFLKTNVQLFSQSLLVLIADS